MKAPFLFSFLFAINTIVATQAQQETARIAKEDTAPVFQRYLATCRMQNTPNQPVQLRNASREKEPVFVDMTILELDFRSTMSIHDLAHHILYGDADVVHLTNTSTQTAAHLYEILQDIYAHCIHVPHLQGGIFLVSKYPLSQAAVTRDVSSPESLEFTIHGANTCYARICPTTPSIQIVNAIDATAPTTTPILLAALPGTWTIVPQHFLPLQPTQKANLLVKDTFHILPIRHKDNDNRSGYSAEVEVHRSWGGKEGGSWGGSARAEAHDDRGNYVEGEVSQNDKGEGSVKGRAGHEENR